MELDKVPLWRGDHVPICQLAEDFSRYVYLPRLRDPDVLAAAARDGLGLLLWQRESFAYADSFDEAAGRYRGLRCGQRVDTIQHSSDGLLVKPEIAIGQQEAEAPIPIPPGEPRPGGDPVPEPGGPPPESSVRPRRYYGTVSLDPARVGRDAGRIAEEVVAHLVGLVGASVTVTLKIEANVPDGTPDNVVRTVTENSRTLKFSTHGFEKE